VSNALPPQPQLTSVAECSVFRWSEVFFDLIFVTAVGVLNRDLRKGKTARTHSRACAASRRTVSWCDSAGFVRLPESLETRPFPLEEYLLFFFVLWDMWQSNSLYTNRCDTVPIAFRQSLVLCLLARHV
jgi:low temperature requirement protein LtrA